MKTFDETKTFLHHCVEGAAALEDVDEYIEFYISLHRPYQDLLRAIGLIIEEYEDFAFRPRTALERAMKRVEESRIS